ncbi:hypothetical protein O9K51_08714 [Purpureocillium lavendulum]|uniref:Ecp2 effector protein domain-containing protein n=1 Tax=Purpureocillium lavendulum TaxID=1247861 RepID=A0AB34FGU1_9HYPO|nr:hypothetical protein O9K51_08714 [Purpureocillium lavendulum]
MKALALSLGLSALCSAATIPSQPSGAAPSDSSYPHQDDDTSIFDPFSSWNDNQTLSTRGKISPPFDPKTAQVGTWCGCNIRIDGGDARAAINDIKKQFGKGRLWSSKSIYSIKGSVVAFACKFASADQIWTDDWTFEIAVNFIGGECGDNTPGTFWDPATREKVLYGIMRYEDGIDFCYKSVQSTWAQCPTGRGDIREGGRPEKGGNK